MENHFETMANILRPGPIVKPKFYYLRKCQIILNNSKDLKDINLLRQNVNKIFNIYTEVQNLIKDLENQKNWYLLQDNPDYYQLEYSIRDYYFKVKDLYHSLHWDLYSFNSY